MGYAMTATVSYKGDGQMHITIPAFNAGYLGALFRSKSAPLLIPLFRKSCDAAKEWTESYAAFHKLRSHIHTPTLAIHVGDGAHCRTGALFALHSAHENVCVDPIFSQANLDSWQNEVKTEVRRLRGIKAMAHECVTEIVKTWRADGGAPVLLTFVHAHVGTGDVLKALPPGSWKAAYTCACCEKPRQLLPACNDIAEIALSGDDFGILSPERTYQVLTPITRPGA
jgi:hypothetical protein